LQIIYKETELGNVIGRQASEELFLKIKTGAFTSKSYSRTTLLKPV